MPTNMKRIMKDLREFRSSPVNGIYVDYDENDMTKLHAMIIGPEDTPYEGGYFFFKMDLSNNYPMNPPTVNIMTYARGTRFHPNLYEDGKVCLSILGTWGKKDWSPMLTIQKILITIQGLMDNNPITHEPSFETTSANNPKAVVYKDIVEHEVIKHAILAQVTNPIFPEFRDIIKEHFDAKKDRLKDRLSKKDTTQMTLKSFHMHKVLNYAELQQSV